LFPSDVFFYCQDRDLSEPGGATGICPSWEVYRRIEEKYPDFIDQISKHGVSYTSLVTHTPDQDPEKGVGRGWGTFFGKACDTKDEVESRMKELGYQWEWMDDKDLLRTTTPVLSAVREAPGSKRKVFFNQIPAMIANAKEFAKGKGHDASFDKFCRAGDGSSLNMDAILFAKEQCEETAVELEWLPSDVCLIDNFAAMHARRPFEGNRRKLLASLITAQPSKAAPRSRL
jgi:hypothetical protein